MAEPKPSNELEKEKFAFEKEIRLRELELRERESRKSGITAAQASLGGAALAVISALGGALITGNMNIAETRESGETNRGVEEIKNTGSINIQRFSLQKDLVLKAIEKENPTDVRNTLLFFANSGLLNEFKDDLISYLATTEDQNLPTGSKLGNLDLALYQRKVRKYRPLLDVIGGSETKGNYNAYYPNKNNISEPNIVNMKLSEVRKWQDDRIAMGSESSATGRYLFLRKTLDDLRSEVGLIGMEPFDSMTQDVLAVRLLERRGLDDFLEGKISKTQFILSLAKEWASIPVSEDTKGANRDVKKGESYYAGDELNAANVELDTLIFALDSIRAGSVSDE